MIAENENGTLYSVQKFDYSQWSEFWWYQLQWLFCWRFADRINLAAWFPIMVSIDWLTFGSLSWLIKLEYFVDHIQEMRAIASPTRIWSFACKGLELLALEGLLDLWSWKGYWTFGPERAIGPSVLKGLLDLRSWKGYWTFGPERAIGPSVLKGLLDLWSWKGYWTFGPERAIGPSVLKGLLDLRSWKGYWTFGPERAIGPSVLKGLLDLRSWKGYWTFGPERAIGPSVLKGLRNPWIFTKNQDFRMSQKCGPRGCRPAQTRSRASTSSQTFENTILRPKNKFWFSESRSPMMDVLGFSKNLWISYDFW